MRKNSKVLVETKTGKEGYIKKYGLQNGKVPVYLTDSRFLPTGEKLLCERSTLKLIGYQD